MINQDLEFRLQELNNQGRYPSVTLLMPLSAMEAEGVNDPDLVLKELIREIKQKISELPDSLEFKAINKKLNNLPVKVPPINLYKGLVAFVSMDHEEVIPLEFAVERKAYIGKNFLLKDIAKLNKKAENDDSEEEKLKTTLIERYFEFKPYGKRTY